jgi:protein-S-isoprenylcysteine O-methyltransferase Ste14
MIGEMKSDQLVSSRLKGLPRFVKVPWDRGGLRTYLVLFAVITSRPDHQWLPWGASLILLGAALHIASKGCLYQDRTAAMSGPYRFVRHPFYLANLLTDMGIAVMSGRWWCVALSLALWLAVYIPVMRGEESHLARIFPDVYPEYLRRVPMLIPFRRPVAASGEGFSWRNPNIVSDSVIPRVMRILAYPLLFFVWQDVRNAGLNAITRGHALVAGIALVALYACALILSRVMRVRRRSALA